MQTHTGTYWNCATVDRERSSMLTRNYTVCTQMHTRTHTLQTKNTLPPAMLHIHKCGITQPADIALSLRLASNPIALMWRRALLWHTKAWNIACNRKKREMCAWELRSCFLGHPSSLWLRRPAEWCWTPKFYFGHVERNNEGGNYEIINVKC